MKMVLRDQSIRESDRSKIRRLDDRNDGICRRAAPAEAGVGAGVNVEDETAGASGIAHHCFTR